MSTDPDDCRPDPRRRTRSRCWLTILLLCCCPAAADRKSPTPDTPDRADGHRRADLPIETFTAADGTKFGVQVLVDRASDSLGAGLRARRPAVLHASVQAACASIRTAQLLAEPALTLDRRLHDRRERDPRPRAPPGLRDQPLRLSDLHRQRPARSDRAPDALSAKSTTSSPKASSCWTTCRRARSTTARA